MSTYPPRNLLAVVLTLACLTGAASSAAADESADGSNWIVLEYGHHSRPQQLTVALDLWPTSAGAALWYAIPVLSDGLINKVNDSLYLEFGALLELARDSYYWQYGTNNYAIAGAIGLRWDFHLTAAWTVYASLKLGLFYGFPPYSRIVPFLNLGAFYALTDAVQLRMELGYPGGISLGLAFLFGK